MNLLSKLSLSLQSHITQKLPSFIFAVTSVVLSGVMGSRFVKTGKFMPAGLVATLR